MAKQTKLVMTGGLIDCPKCRSIVHELLDDDGVRYCGHCHARVSYDN